MLLNPMDMRYIRPKNFKTIRSSTHIRALIMGNDNIESISNRVWRYHSFAYKIKEPSLQKLIKLSIKQLKFFIQRFMRGLINFDLDDINISFKILTNFIKLEYKFFKKNK